MIAPLRDLACASCIGVSQAFWRFAPLKSALLKSASGRFVITMPPKEVCTKRASFKSAYDRSAPPRRAKDRSAYDRFVLLKLALIKSSPTRLALLRSAPLKSAVFKLTVLLPEAIKDE